MNRTEFIGRLTRSIRGMKSGEVDEIVADYEEHFRIGIESGKDEEEIARSLGNPKMIGKSYQVDATLNRGEGKPRFKDVLSAVLASLSLGFFNIVFVLGPFLGLVGVLIGMWAAGIALGLSGVAALIGIILQPVLPPELSIEGVNVAFLVSASIGAAALGFLAVIGLWQLTKLFARGTGRYLRFNAQFIRRKRGEENE